MTTFNNITFLSEMEPWRVRQVTVKYCYSWLCGQTCSIKCCVAVHFEVSLSEGKWWEGRSSETSFACNSREINLCLLKWYLWDFKLITEPCLSIDETRLCIAVKQQCAIKSLDCSAGVFRVFTANITRSSRFAVMLVYKKGAGRGWRRREEFLSFPSPFPVTLLVA